jgi:hypothetical protein
MKSECSERTDLPRSVPWTAAMDRSDYIAKLWQEADRRRVEAARLERIIDETIAEARRIEALAEKLASDVGSS